MRFAPPSVSEESRMGHVPRAVVAAHYDEQTGWRRAKYSVKV
jgi:hypothetical protein